MSNFTHRSALRDLRRGGLAIAPLLPGVIVFGLLYGVLGRQAGLTPFQVWAMSMTVFAGSAQFVAVGMWGANGALPIILTTLVINLRHLLMGLSIGPHFQAASRRARAASAFWLTDEAYAVSIAAYRQGHGSMAYYLGAALGIYLVWPISSLIGALAGRAIPDPARWGLDLIFPLTFLGLLFTFLDNRASVVVALVSGLIALAAARLLPGTWYVIVAGVLGAALGVILERRSAVANP